mgnify:CR=1 FL=1
MTFTVIVPCHNDEGTIARTLTSILRQSYGDFEVLVIDDASSDGTRDAIAEFTDARIRCARRHTPGPGGYAARNLGIALARGEFIAFLDADDVWDEHHLATMADVVARHPDVTFFSSAWQSVLGNETVQNAFSRSIATEEVRVDLERYFHLIRSRRPPVWTGVACMRRSALTSTDVFPTNPKIRRGGDTFAWLRLVCEHGEIVVSNHVGATYMRNDSTVTRTSPPSHEIYRPEAYEELAALVPARLHPQLMRHFNRALAVTWIRNVIEDGSTFPLWDRIWLGGMDRLVVGAVALSLLPNGLVRAVLSVGLALRPRRN